MNPRWHEDDSFWADAQEVMFDANRLLLAASEVSGAERLLALQPGAKILDMCCGPGRHSLLMARKGYKVTGVDRTEAYLSSARKQAAGLPATFILADAREYVAPEEFDAALCLYTSIGYFEDPMEDRRLLQNLFTSLKPGGGLLLQIAGKEIAARRHVERTWFDMGDLLVLQTSHIVPPFEKMHTTWRLLRDGKEKEIEFLVRLYSATEMRQMLRELGFEDVRAFGDYDGTPYDEHAKKLVMMARKPE